MNSKAMQIMGTVLRVVGIIVLALGICGLTLAPVAAVLMSMSLYATSLTIAGSVITASSTGILVGRFFSKKKWDDDNQESYKMEKIGYKKTCGVNIGLHWFITNQ